MKVAIYARNSKPPRGWRPKTPGEAPPGSWELQIKACREAAARAGDEVVLEAHDVATGSDPNRPEWQSVLAAVQGGTVRRVYCTKMDRPARSARHYLDVAEVFVARGAELIFVDQAQANVSKDDAFSKMVRGVGAVFAEFELDLARERSRAVMEVREDGRTYGPRSQRPAGAPRAYGEGHKMRRRGGKLWHDKSRCRLCRDVAEPGGPRPGGGRRENEGVAERDGSATPGRRLATPIEASERGVPSGASGSTEMEAVSDGHENRS